MRLRSGSAAKLVRRSSLALVVLFAAVFMTFLAWRITKNSVDNSAEQEFMNIVEDSNDAITQRMLDYTIALDSGVGLLRSSDVPVTRVGWKKFADSLKLRTQFAGIQGLGYAVLVPPDQKPDFEKSIRAEGFPDFAIQPPGNRDPYSAIVYLEPFDFRNQRAFGFDMYSEPTRREAMQSAARTGLATVSGPVTLVQETDEDIQRGFLMYVPYYRNGAPVDTVEQREAALVGWVYAPFRTRDLMEGVLPPKARDFFTEIYYGNEPTAESLLYVSPRSGDFTPGRTALTSFPIGNRTWTSRFTSGETTSARSSEPWIVAGTGLVIDALLFLVIASMALRRERAEELAVQMTADLRTSNTSLLGFMQIVETTPSLVAIFEVDGKLKYLNRAWRSLLSLADNDPLPNTTGALFDRVALDRLRDVAVPAALRDGVWSGESILAEKGGDQLEVNLTVLRHEEASGADERLLTLVAHDITGYKNTQRLTTLTEELRRNLTAGDDPIRSIRAIGENVLAAVRADGLVARVGLAVFRLGDAPAQDAIDRHVRELIATGETLQQVTDCLASDMSDLATSGRCAGAILARLPGTREAYLCWFRRPAIPSTRTPVASNSIIAKGGFGWRQNRTAADELAENAQERSRPWSDYDRAAADMIYRAVQSGMIEYSYRQLAFEATIDPLTGLGNRRALAMTMDNERRSRTQAPRFSLLFIDLDRFKQLNDAFGHEKGDVALRMAGTRLTQVTSEVVGRSGSVFRLGGDEFVVLLRDVPAHQVARLSERLVAAFRDPLILNDSTHVVNVSVGAVVGAEGAATVVDADELLRRGDLAMYSAKRAGGSRVAFYQDSFSNQAVHRLELEQELYRALEDDQLTPAFQPIVSLRSGAIVGAEALARWRQPEIGLLEPGEFIQLAEETGQIRQLDRQIAERAVTRCSELLRDRSKEFHLAFNVSGKTLDEQYIAYLSELIDRFEIPPERLTVELTESAMVGGSDRLQQLLIALRSLGVKVAIDDFGTGYSSLAYLQGLPADVVKLDRTFVDRLHGNPGDDVVARWAIQLVSDLGMTILAEGVETAEQEQALLALGYDWAQGYRYGRPVFEPPIPGDYSDFAGAPPG